MKIGVVGLGLMGGSVAKALKAATGYTVVGVDTDVAVMEAALLDNAIDETDGMEECDVVFLCLRPHACVEYFDGAEFAPGAIVTDICGVKRYMADALGGRAAARGVRYVGSHPMAGREVSGYEASDADLFDGASYVVTRTEDTCEDALRVVGELALQLGCARVTVTTPEDHDSVIAYTSQLAHVVSNAYIKNNNAGCAGGFSAGSFADLTRVARLEPGMWAELFLLNRDNLLREIDEVSAHIGELRKALDAEDPGSLEEVLRRGSDRKKHLEG